MENEELFKKHAGPYVYIVHIPKLFNTSIMHSYFEKMIRSHVEGIDKDEVQEIIKELNAQIKTIIPFGKICKSQMSLECFQILKDMCVELNFSILAVVDSTLDDNVIYNIGRQVVDQIGDSFTDKIIEGEF